MRRCIIGIVSVAPVTEVSGQGRAIAQLFSGPEAGSGVVMSDRTDISTASDIARSVTLVKARGRWADRLARRGCQRAADIMHIYETIRRRSTEIEKAAIWTRCDALVGCSGDPYDLAATASASRRLGIPFFAYAFDDPIDQWPDALYRLVARIAAWRWRPVAKAVFVPNELLEATWRARGVRTVLVRNPVAYDGNAAAAHLSPHPALAGSEKSGIPVLYTGSVYHAQADAIRNLLAAMNRLQGRFHLHVFSEQSAERVASFGVSGPHVTYHGSVPAAEIPQVLASAAILFLPLGFETGVSAVIRTAAPGKLGDYLMSGQPILAHVPADSFVAEFCRRHECARLVDRPDPSALADVLEFLARGGPEVERLRAHARACAAEFAGPHVREIFWSTIDEVLATESMRTRSDDKRRRASEIPSAAAWLISAPAILRRTGIGGVAKVARSAAFDADDYRLENPDVGAVRKNPLAHFLARGATEGREPNYLFDRSFYLRQAGEAARENPFLHYLESGWQKGFDPGPFFDVTDYLEAFADVRDGETEPLGHFLRIGAAEGRRPFAGFRLPAPLALPPAPAAARDCKFSVIVPTFNHGHYLRHALDSVLAQSHGNWEAVVVDDGSTDDTPAIVAEYAKRDARIIGVRKTNGGVASALNEGMRRASADWFMWLSADDLFRPNRMAVAAEWIGRRPHVGLFHSDVAVLHDATGRVDERAHASPQWARRPPLQQSLAMLHANLVEGITATFHRRLAEALGGFRQDLRYAQDYDFWLRASRRTPIAFVPEATAVSRSYGGQATVVRQQAAEHEALQAVSGFLGEHSLHAVVGGLDPNDADQLFAASRWALALATFPGSVLVRNGAEQALFDWLAASVIPERRADYRARLEEGMALNRRRKRAKQQAPKMEALLVTVRGIGNRT